MYDSDAVGILLSLVGVAVRIAVGLLVGLVVAVPVSLALDAASFVTSFAAACLALGALSILMTFGGESPGRRMGLQDPWLASFYPGIARKIGEKYDRTTLSDSAVFLLAGACLVITGSAILGGL
jgi:hypothetical protein